MTYASIQQRSKQQSEIPIASKPVFIKHADSVQSVLQPKLKMGAVNDKYEQEADRVADAVVSGRQKHCAVQVGQYTPGNGIQCKSQANTSVSSVTDPINASRSLGTGSILSANQRQSFERSMGQDFSQVRIHKDDSAADAAQSIHARAYTQSNHIVFGAGEYNPDSKRGKQLLAHELTHVVQQRNSPFGVLIQRDLAIEPPNPDAEGRVLTAAEIQAAIEFNNQVLGSIDNSAAIIELIRDVFGRGITPTPAVVDNDFVRGVVDWQATHGLTQDGKLGPRTAKPLFREIGAEGAGKGKVKRWPRYNIRGPINVARGGTRQANFNMFAEFDSDPPNKFFPSCCEIRQDIQWDAAFVTASVAQPGGLRVPHTGFPAAHPANRWIEDRDSSNKRYGHRSGRFSDPASFDQYLDTRRRNQAFGHIYRGSDTPTVLAADRGSWSFRLRVIDVCSGNRRLATSRTLTINWL